MDRISGLSDELLVKILLGYGVFLSEICHYIELRL
ncbi:unnamed protein product [Brassica oleracea var. botrytis]|uniref:Uncharacterized protein n=1 Tax=Brassica oleracea TaxID=3712 RepID=A0A3P6GBY4_BRAOL|nr:unnamed protein product [Brassica oleracea]